jgi:hypothetical protein
MEAVVHDLNLTRGNGGGGRSSPAVAAHHHRCSRLGAWQPVAGGLLPDRPLRRVPSGRLSPAGDLLTHCRPQIQIRTRALAWGRPLLRRADPPPPRPCSTASALQFEAGHRERERERGRAPPPDRGGLQRERAKEMPPPVSSSRGEEAERARGERQRGGRPAVGMQQR